MKKRMCFFCFSKKILGNENGRHFIAEKINAALYTLRDNYNMLLVITFWDVHMISWCQREEMTHDCAQKNHIIYYLVSTMYKNGIDYSLQRFLEIIAFWCYIMCNVFSKPTTFQNEIQNEMTATTTIHYRFISNKNTTHQAHAFGYY